MVSLPPLLWIVLTACSGGDAPTKKQAVRAGYCDAYVRYVCDCRRLGASACKSITDVIATEGGSMESQCKKLLRDMKTADKGKEIICRDG